MKKPKVRASFRLRAPKTPPTQTIIPDVENLASKATTAFNTDSTGLSPFGGTQPVPTLLNEESGQKNQSSITARNHVEPVSELDAIIQMVTKLNGSSGKAGTATEIGSSPADESENARPLEAGVENDATDIGKEQEMQTAAQLKPISESGITENIDLRDAAPVKEDIVIDSAKTNVSALVSESMASLFGPVIEDDVKGVRNQIRELIQCELQGELGQRFSRNLRIVIRREIAAAIDDQFDRV